MSLRLLAVTFDARDPAGLAEFWAAVLGRESTHDPGGPLLLGTVGQLSLRFVANATAKVEPNRMHLHLTSDRPADQARTVAAALGLGARHLDVGQRPDEKHVVLGDPEGNEFCVIEAGNAFLDGCGFLGELACDGAREVGVFWSRALGWPLVWDHDDETAIQSAPGGTKLAWGGGSVDPQEAPHRQRFELAVPDGDPAAEVSRLVGLGAARLGTDEAGHRVLADPDGHEFWLTGP